LSGIIPFLKEEFVMKRITMISLTVLIFVLFASFSAFAADQDQTPSTLQVMDRVEELLYGQIRTGGLIDRLSNAESSLFGRELPGSIADRQNALLNFIEKGDPNQPSMLFKLGVAEWALGQKVHAFQPIDTRVADLEKTLEGGTQENKALAMRLERLLGLLLSENVTMAEVQVPADSVMKAEFLETLSPADARVGDEVKMALAEDLVIGNNLVAPGGSIIKAEIAEVKKPRSFGRSSEIKISFDSLYPLDHRVIDLVMGKEAEEAAKAEASQMAAVGTSFVGAILLGPVGLAGGFLVKGDAKEVPEGTELFVQTLMDQRINAYPVPAGLQGMIETTEKTPESDDLFDEREDGEVR